MLFECARVASIFFPQLAPLQNRLFFCFPVYSGRFPAVRPIRQGPIYPRCLSVSLVGKHATKVFNVYIRTWYEAGQ